jgi:hypothetical protein
VIEGKASIRTGEPLPPADRPTETGSTAASSEKEVTTETGTEGSEKGR